jgi:SAM-dependent methyltransferase
MASEQQILRLNMGGGEQKMDGWQNVDLMAPNPDLRANLFEFPWPWKDSTVDAVAMIHFLEHVNDVERTVLEVHRILKPGGTFWVIVPHVKNPAAFAIDHRHFFSSTTIKNISTQSYYQWGGKHLFRTQSFKMPVIHWKWIKWTPLDWFSSRYPVVFEKFVPIAPAWIDWVGVKI